MKTFLTLALFFTISAHAFTLDESTLDPQQEAEAQAIFAQLRCVVCQGQSVRDSQADLAIAMRSLVRNKLSEGKNEQQIMDELRVLYGHDVALTPNHAPQNILLWYAPLFFAIIGLVAIRQTYKKRK